MNKHFKLLAILLSVILCFSVFSLTVSAIDADGDGFDDETGEFVGEDETSSPIYTDPVYEPTDATSYEQPTDATSYEQPTDAPSYDEPDYNQSDDTQSSDYNYDDDNNNYFVDEPSYVGGGQSYVAPVSTAPSVPLIDSDHSIDDNELSSKDWKDISSNLKNAGNSGDDSDDFSFIQKNTSSGDNGNWILIVGVVLVLLSIAGIVYFIASGVLLRKKLAPSGASSASRSGGTQTRYRSNDDYDDGYKVSKKEAKQKDRSRRYDTADIKLPKNKGKNRYR